MGRTAVAVAAALVALAFGMSTFERWLGRRQRHDLTWSFSLGLFFVAAAALAAGAGLGWDAAWFRTFYLFGAILNVPFLALGTVYLLLGPRIGDRVAVVLLVAAGFCAGVVVTAGLRGPVPADRLVQGSQVFGALPRVLAGVASGGGALVVLGGAVWSIVRRRRILANALISSGTLILGASGLLNSVFDAMTAFAVTLLIGISVVFAGFVVASSPGPAAERRDPANVHPIRAVS